MVFFGQQEFLFLFSPFPLLEGFKYSYSCCSHHNCAVFWLGLPSGQCGEEKREEKKRFPSHSLICREPGFCFCFVFALWLKTGVICCQHTMYYISEFGWRPKDKREKKCNINFHYGLLFRFGFLPSICLLLLTLHIPQVGCLFCPEILGVISGRYRSTWLASNYFKCCTSNPNSQFYKM